MRNAARAAQMHPRALPPPPNRERYRAPFPGLHRAPLTVPRPSRGLQTCMPSRTDTDGEPNINPSHMGGKRELGPHLAPTPGAPWTASASVRIRPLLLSFRMPVPPLPGAARALPHRQAGRVGASFDHLRGAPAGSAGAGSQPPGHPATARGAPVLYGIHESESLRHQRRPRVHVLLLLQVRDVRESSRGAHQGPPALG
jgi:hypothetical protein